MRAKEYDVLLMAVEAGIGFGLSRADKHASDPLTDAQRERLTGILEREVMNAICQWFHFEDPDDGGAA